MATTANRVGNVVPRAFSTEDIETWSAASIAASVTSDNPAMIWVVWARLSVSDAESRKSSRRRIARIAATALSASSCRESAEAISVVRDESGRGESSLSEANMATASGDRKSRSDTYLLDDSTRAIRSAASDSSRSNRRYHGVAPKASLIRRNPSNPASGSGPSPNHPRRTGSRVR